MMGDVLEFPMELSSKYGCWEKFKKWPMTDEIDGNSPDGLNFEQWLKSQKGWKFQINLVFEKGPKFKINQKFRLAMNFKCWSMMQKSLMTWFK